VRILFTRFPLESRMGGAEVQTLALMRGLQERGHEVMFLGSCPVLLREAFSFQLSAVRLKIGSPPVTKWRALSFLWEQCSMRRKLHASFSILHSSFHPDAVVMLSLTEKLLLTPYLHAQGITVIWVEHDRVGCWLTKNPWLPRLRKLSRYATTIVVSELSKAIYERLGFANVIAIPNGIDVSRLSGNRNAEDGNQKVEFRVGTIARLSWDKGVDVLIEAVKGLEDVSLTIVGTGPEEQKLKAESRKLQACSLLPYRENLHDFYASLDIFVLPSREHDPFGLVAGEAMLCGIPVIVTDACGIAGYVKSESDAIVVPADDPQALRAAITSLMAHDAKREMIGREGRKTAERLFGMEKMVEGYERVIQTMESSP